MPVIKGSVSSESDLSGRLGKGSYSLPTATKLRLGGIKVGEGLAIETDGTLNVNQNAYSRLYLAHTGGTVDKSAESPNDTVKLAFDPAFEVIDSNDALTFGLNFGSPLDTNKPMTGRAIKSYVDYSTDAIKDMHNNYVLGTSVTGGIDLDTLITPGWYYGLGSGTYKNCPTSGSNFALCVLPSADGSGTGTRVGQMFVTTGAISTVSIEDITKIYIRGVRRVKSLVNGAVSYSHTEWVQLASSADMPKVPQDTFTKTIGNAVNITDTVTLDIGFTPKCFEIYGICSSTGIYLRWDDLNDWSGNAGPLYDYYIDLDNDTVTISTHMPLNDSFMWRAFG